MNDKLMYFFDVYEAIDDKKTKRLRCQNEKKNKTVSSVKIKTDGYQRRMAQIIKITASLSVGRVSKVKTNAFTSTPIYNVRQTHLYPVILKEQL